MISKRISYICDDYEQIENYDKAIADTENMWICHHRKELDENGHRLYTMQQLKDENLYFHRPPEELIFLTNSEHWKLHMNEEQKERLRSHQLNLWKDADKLRDVKAKAKKRRDDGLNLVNIEQLSSKSAYRDYQRLQHRIWYDKNRDNWNLYNYIKKLNLKTIDELEALINKHKNCIMMHEKTGNDKRVEKLKKYIELIQKVLDERINSIVKNNEGVNE